MPFIEASAGQIHYRLEGPPGAPLLLLSNSLGTNLEMWNLQTPRFIERFRVLRYDSRGHGQSLVTPGPYTIEQLARDVIALLDGLHVERANFCGLSMGGMIGMWIGLHLPERLEKLVLCNTAALIGPPERWNARIEDVRKGGMEAIVSSVLERWFTPSFREHAPEAVEPIRQMLVKTSADGYISCCAAIRDMDLREEISTIRLPTLVITGAHDPATPPEDGRFIASKIQAARYVELDAAHISNVEAQEQFTAEVMSFLF
jgi:3-oxoadipate enol-lactonase